MKSILQELANLARQKSTLLKHEAELWDRLSLAVSNEPQLGELLDKELPSTSAKALSQSLIPSNILRFSDVCRLTSLSRSGIYSLIKEKRFPAPMQIGLRTLGWLERDISQWIQDKANQR